MNKAFYACEHGGNPAECKDCKIKLLQDSLATQQEMTADLADELKVAEARLQAEIAMHRSRPEDNALYQSWMKSLEPVFVRENKRLAGELETAESELAEVRRQERKACMALVNMSGKVSGDGAREMLASIKLAEAELAKEDALTETDNGKVSE